MALRVWCPQSVSVRPDSSVMVVVAGSAGCASHTFMGWPCLCGGCRHVWVGACLLAGGSYEQRGTLVWGPVRWG